MIQELPVLTLNRTMIKDNKLQWTGENGLEPTKKIIKKIQQFVSFLTAYCKRKLNIKPCNNRIIMPYFFLKNPKTPGSFNVSCYQIFVTLNDRESGNDKI